MVLGISLAPFLFIKGYSMQTVIEEEIQLIRPEYIVFPTYWQRFSRRMRVRYEKMLCMLFKRHNWALQIRSWELSHISSLEDYRRNKANNLKCIYCEEIHGVNEVDMDHLETYWYEFQTHLRFKRKRNC